MTATVSNALLQRLRARRFACPAHDRQNCLICREATRAWSAEGRIPAGYVPDAWTDPLLPAKTLYALFVLFIACVGLPVGVLVGRWIVGAVFG